MLDACRGSRTVEQLLRAALIASREEGAATLRVHPIGLHLTPTTAA